MARTNIELIQAIRGAAKSLDQSPNYQWGHMGSCNCGFLAQEISQLSKEDIHQRAMQKYGDWNEQLNDYCPTSGLPMDTLISCMLDIGLDTEDLKNLEKLSDPKVLRSFPIEQRWLKHNNKSDVILYMNRWATVLEQELLESVIIPSITLESEKVEV